MMCKRMITILEIIWNGECMYIGGYMKKRILQKDIDDFIDNYERTQKYKPNPPMKMDALRKLLTGETSPSFQAQDYWDNPENLEYNFRSSVKDIKRNKDAAIEVYKLFLDFLVTKGITAKVEFPPIPVSNSFERLMYIAKYFHEPDKKISELSTILWVDRKTIKNDIKKLRGDDKDPLQVCKKAFKIPEIDDSKKDTLIFESTAHPLFLTPNLTQVLVMLKGLKEMSENPLYGNSAKITAAIIWEQLSDYAKKRIPEVMQKLLSEDTSWYENLKAPVDTLYLTERSCVVENADTIFYYAKGGSFCMEVMDGEDKDIYTNCHNFRFYDSDNFSFEFDKGEKKLSLKNEIRIAQTLNGIH